MKKVNILLSVLLAIFLISMVSAGNMITPANGATIAGTAAVLNATNSTTGGATNCTFYAMSADTANNTWALIAGPIQNTSAQQKSINTTFNTNVLEDGPNYQFNATCRNETNSLTSGSTITTGIFIDNTVPGTPTALSPVSFNILQTGTSKTFSASVTDGTTTSCNFFISKNPMGNTFDSFNGTYSTSTCTYTLYKFNSSATNGNYLWYIQANDGINSTSSSANTIQVQFAGVGGVPASVGNSYLGKTFSVASITGTGDSKGMLIIIILFIVGIFIYLKNK